MQGERQDKTAPRKRTILATETESESELENINYINDANIDERDEPDNFTCITPWKRVNTSLETLLRITNFSFRMKFKVSGAWNTAHSIH